MVRNGWPFITSSLLSSMHGRINESRKEEVKWGDFFGYVQFPPEIVIILYYITNLRCNHVQFTEFMILVGRWVQL